MSAPGTSVFPNKRKPGSWTYEVRVTDSNGVVKKYQRTAKTKSEAKRLAQELRSATQNQRVIVKHVTLDSLLNSYITHKRGRIRETTLAEYVYLLRKYVLPKFGKRKPSQIDRSELAGWMNSLKERNFTVSTINTIRARFQDLMKYALEEQLIDANPLTTVRPLRQQGPGPNVKTPWNKTETTEALAEIQAPVLHAIAALLVTTGMRKGEMLALRWSDLSFENATIRISKTRGSRRLLTADNAIVVRNVESQPKTQASNRTVGVPAIALDALRELSLGRKDSDEDAYIFLGVKGGRLSPGQLAKNYKRELEEHTLRFIRIHDIRHTSGTLSLVAGARIEETNQALGHTEINTTKRLYAPYVQPLNDRFATKLGDYLAE